MWLLLFADANDSDSRSIEEEWCLVIESTLKRPTPVAEVVGQVSKYKSLPTEPWKASPVLFFPSLSDLSGQTRACTPFINLRVYEFCFRVYVNANSVLGSR